MIKDEQRDIFPKRCAKCFYKSKHGNYCYIKPRATHGCAAFTKR